MSLALAFLDPRALDYGARLGRLRWRRAAGVATSVEWDEAAPAAEALAGADAWMAVLDAAAVPVFDGEPQIPAARVRIALRAAPVVGAVHTLRELERFRTGARNPAEGETPAAVAFRPAEFPPVDLETIKLYIDRLLADSTIQSMVAGFSAVSFEEASERERPELTRRVGEGALSILDAGCGAGAAIAAAKARFPAWKVTGIERDPELARRARARCDRVLQGDLREILPSLAAAGERYDVLVFADVLEHLEDPVAALAAARRLAAPQARLIVSVPNVGHLSIARDLLAGRFDPVAAGLCDVRHLRWFTRASLAEALSEAGWSVAAIESEAGAAAPDPAALCALAASWPGGDLESLATYQWIAVGAA